MRCIEGLDLFLSEGSAFYTSQLELRNRAEVQILSANSPLCSSKIQDATYMVIVASVDESRIGILPWLENNPREVLELVAGVFWD